MNPAVGFGVVILVLVSLPASQAGLPPPYDQCDQLNITQTLNDTSDPPDDDTCPNSFEAIITSDIQALSESVGQDLLDLDALYLCGTHCGHLFYNAVDTVCGEIKDEFLTLFCSRHTPSPTDPDPTYCVFAELYVNMTNIVSECGSSFLAFGNCSVECSRLLYDAVERIGCCIHTRYNSSIGFLRSADSIPAQIFSSSLLYETCGVDIPGFCDPAYVDGVPVYTDAPSEEEETTTSSSPAVQPGDSLVLTAALPLIFLGFLQ